MNDMNDNPDAHPKSTGGLVCGIIGCILGGTFYLSLFGFPFCLIAWILGAKAVKRARALGVGAGGSAITAKVMGIIGTLITGIAVLIVVIMLAVAAPNFVRYRDASNQAACRINMSQIKMAYETATVSGLEVKGLDDLVGADNNLLKAPKCPSGGTYTLRVDPDDETATCVCSKHGSFEARD